MYDINPEQEARRDQRRATGFVEDPRLEQLLEMKEKQPDKFERIASANVHMELGYYASAKAAAERTGEAA